ncbi:MAG: MFS transporter [Candidatus Limnocylindrales bacterium]
MLITVVVALILGILIGGHPENLSRIRFRWGLLLFVAVLLRYGTEAAIRYQLAPAAEFRLPLYALAFALIAVTLWANRDQPGLLLAAAGVTSNGLAIVLDGGWMPVWRPAMDLVGMTPADLTIAFHRLLPEQLGLQFLLRGGPFGDLIPVPLPVIPNVASIGDAFVAAGLGWYVFATLVLSGEHAPGAGTEAVGGTPGAAGTEPGNLAAAGAAGAASAAGATSAAKANLTPSAATAGFLVPPPPRRRSLRLRRLPGPGPRAGIGETAVLHRPVLLGGAGAGVDLLPAPGPIPVAVEIPTARRRGIRERLRGHPYVKLALDARFSTLWVGQTISLLGDRLNQVALGVLVLSLTGSALDVGLTFMAATLPNLLFSPFAGTFVDRWNQKHVMVVSDLLRAGLVLLIPLAAQHSVLLSYPIVFGVTTVSIFFRPARSAVIPRIVATEDLTPANGAMWTAETIADVVGYPIAGIFVAFLGSALALAFWFDAASYVVSAALVLSLAIPPVVRSAAPVVAGSVRKFLAEVAAGWRFLRSEPALFQNTVISGLAQFAVGALVALPVVYARDVLQGSPIPYPQSYAAIDLALGVGNLVGGIAIGAIGAKRRKGPFVIGGYVVLGLATMSLGLTGNEVLALTLTLFAGLANMAFIIPTQTLFAERTPQDLMGRVVGIRSSMVLGPMTIGIALSGILAQSMGAAAVFILFGLFTALAGAVGLLLPAVRET